MKLGFTMQAPKTMVMFCDESSQNLRHYVIGGLYFSPSNPANSSEVISSCERELSEIKRSFALDAGTLKWAKVPNPGQYLDGYIQFLNWFLEDNRLSFKCLVVDRHKYPLDSRTFMEKDPLVGYLKFYCVFLADGFLRWYPEHFFDIRIHQFQGRPGHTAAELERSVEGRYVKRAEPSNRYFRYCTIKTVALEDSNLLQLTDILVGAVAFAWNGGRERTSKRSQPRQELVDLIESKRHVTLDRPTPVTRTGVNIWRFESTRQPATSADQLVGNSDG